MNDTRPIHYLPPRRNDVLEISRATCDALYETTGDAGFVDPQVLSGLADFLTACGAVLADGLNNEVDDVAR